MPDAEVDPLASARRPSSTRDAWQGARIGNRIRRAQRDARRAAERRAMAEVDIGEPQAPRVTIAVLAVATFATLVAFQRVGAEPTARELDAAGGISALALARGEWSSVVMANLLHGGIQHLFLNVFIIFLLGRWLEHLVGRWLLLAVVGMSALGSAIGAVVVSPLAVTIGASGMAFGLLGCAIVVDPRARTHVGVLGRTLGIIQLIGTFLVAGISVGGHLGGLVAGMLVGLVAWDRRGADAHPVGRPRRRLARGIALASVALLVFLAAWEHVDSTTAASTGREVGGWLVRIRTEMVLAG